MLSQSLGMAATIVPRVARCPQALASPSLVISKSLCPTACQASDWKGPLKGKCLMWLDTQSSRVLNFTLVMSIVCQYRSCHNRSKLLFSRDIPPPILLPLVTHLIGEMHALEFLEFLPELFLLDWFLNTEVATEAVHTPFMASIGPNSGISLPAVTHLTLLTYNCLSPLSQIPTLQPAAVPSPQGLLVR